VSVEPFRHHVYVCDQRKPEGVPSCSARGSAAVIEALRREIAAQGLSDSVQLTTCGSLGLCERGPNMVVYPEGDWYSGVRPEDVPEIVREHLGRGRPVARLVSGHPAALQAEIAQNRARYQAAVAARDAAGVVPDEIAVPLRAFMESRVLLTALELDVFSEPPGLVILEVELDDPEEKPQLPPSIAARVVREVSTEPAYANHRLALRPGAPADGPA
jgi:(2Fe-2S) ferredoxin